MTKKEFNRKLHKKLKHIPSEERKKTEEYYNELIEDRIEDGMSEEDAVNTLGTVDEIVAGISLETNISVKPQKDKNNTLKIVLLVLGFPLWFPILIAVAAVVFSLFISLWTVVISLFSVPIAFGGSAIALFAVIFVFMFTNHVITDILFLIGGILICTSLCIFSWSLCSALAKLVIKFTKYIFTKGWRKNK